MTLTNWIVGLWLSTLLLIAITIVMLCLGQTAWSLFPGGAALAFCVATAALALEVDA